MGGVGTKNVMRNLWRHFFSFFFGPSKWADWWPGVPKGGKSIDFPNAGPKWLIFTRRHTHTRWKTRQGRARSPTITSLVCGCCFFFFLPRQSNWFPQPYSSRTMFLTWKTRNRSIQFSTEKKKSFPAEINQTKVVSLSVERERDSIQKSLG